MADAASARIRTPAAVARVTMLSLPSLANRGRTAFVFALAICAAACHGPVGPRMCIYALLDMRQTQASRRCFFALSEYSDMADRGGRIDPHQYAASSSADHGASQ